MKKLKTSILLSLLPLSLWGQEPDKDALACRHVGTVAGSLYAYGSEPGYGLSASYSFFPLRHVGVTATAGFQNWYDAYLPPFEMTDNTGQVCTRDDDDDKALRMYLSVGPSLRTPSVKIGRRENIRLLAQIDPALVVTLAPNESFLYTRPYEHQGVMRQMLISARGRNGQWLSWQVKTSLSLALDRGILSLGYSLSNMDPYSGRRHIFFGGRPVPADVTRHRFSHQIFASIAVGW